MAYTLQALITDEAAARTAAPTAAVVVPLPQGKVLIPLSDRMREIHDIPFLPLTDDGQENVPRSIEDVAKPIAKTAKIAYVEAEFFGGDGTQACVTWGPADTASRVVVDGSAINTALQFLGVNKGEHHDEFDAVGLGRHRSTEDWERPA
jgi:hypothetical protein